jgi:SAM-dependent methyltransferase
VHFHIDDEEEPPVTTVAGSLFYPRVLESIDPAWDTAADLGAGHGRQAISLASRLQRVFAVDLNPAPKDLPPNVTWVRERIENWVARLAFDQVDLVLMRNSLQFLNREYGEIVLATLAQVVNRGGVVAIATFNQEARPPTPAAWLSLWHLSDLREFFRFGWEVIYAVEEVHEGTGMDDKTKRLWFTTQLIVRRTSVL